MKTSTKTALLAAISSILALGAANAYADDNRLVLDNGQSKAWIYTKSAVTPDAAFTGARVVVRDTELPELVVPLNTDFGITAVDAPDLAQPVRYSRGDMRRFDITARDDDPLFIGSNGVSEFDTLDAQRQRAAYPTQLGVDPLTPVAGAGLATAF